MSSLIKAAWISSQSSSKHFSFPFQICPQISIDSVRRIQSQGLYRLKLSSREKASDRPWQLCVKQSIHQ